jgi:hypothetical protein
MTTDIASQIADLRDQLSKQLARRGSNDPFVEHLRWQIASLERQSRHDRAGAGTKAPASPRNGSGAASAARVPFA